MAPTVRQLPLDKVVIFKGRRPLGDVTDLAASIQEIGLLHPITVTSENVLVAGLHRLEACRSLKWVKIPAVVVSLDGLRADLAQIDENLIRHDLTELERAQELRKRKQVYEALHPETRQVRERGGPGRGRKTTAKLAVVSFGDDTASKAGVSSRTVRRSVQIAENIDPKAAEIIREHPIADNQRDLLRFVALDKKKQRAVARKLRKQPDTSLARAVDDVTLDERLRLGKKSPVVRRVDGGGDHRNVVLIGDALSVLKGLPDEIVQTCVTSPPYYRKRDFEVGGQIGLEATPNEYVSRLVDVFTEVRRVLRPDGVLWVNLGDTYAGGGGFFPDAPSNRAGSRQGRVTGARTGGAPVGNGLKPKDLIGIPWMVAFALRADGWWLRSDIIWSKPSPLPEAVRDRCTVSHEYLFMLSKSATYYFDADAIAEPSVDKDRHGHPSRNRRSVWTVPPQSGGTTGHGARYPTGLPELCILASTRTGDLVLDPFAGSGTTLDVAKKLGRDFLGVELNPDYGRIIEARMAG